MSLEGARRRAAVVLAGGGPGPLRRIGVRFAVALGLIVLVAIVTYIGRDECAPEEDGISRLDAFYYSTVSLRSPSTVIA